MDIALPSARPDSTLAAHETEGFEQRAAQVLSMARNGDPRSSSYLYALVVRDVHRVVYRTLGPDNEHQDVVHDVFVECVRNLHRLREAPRLRPWVCSVALNVTRSVIRRRSVRRRTCDTTSIPDSHGSDEGSHRSWHAARRLCSIVARLPPQEQRVFRLRFVEEHRISEIAASLGISESTVKRRLRRAVRRTRTAAAHDSVLAGEWTT